MGPGGSAELRPRRNAAEPAEPASVMRDGSGRGGGGGGGGRPRPITTQMHGERATSALSHTRLGVQDAISFFGGGGGYYGGIFRFSRHCSPLRWKRKNSLLFFCPLSSLRLQRRSPEVLGYMTNIFQRTRSAALIPHDRGSRLRPDARRPSLSRASRTLPENQRKVLIRPAGPMARIGSPNHRMYLFIYLQY